MSGEIIPQGIRECGNSGRFVPYQTCPATDCERATKSCRLCNKHNVTFYRSPCPVYVMRVILTSTQNPFGERKNIMLFAPKEKGQGLVEYAIILALVAIVVIAVMRLLGPKIGNTFSTINNSLP